MTETTRMHAVNIILFAAIIIAPVRGTIIMQGFPQCPALPKNPVAGRQAQTIFGSGYIRAIHQSACTQPLDTTASRRGWQEAPKGSIQARDRREASGPGWICRVRADRTWAGRACLKPTSLSRRGCSAPSLQPFSYPMRRTAAAASRDRNVPEALGADRQPLPADLPTSWS